MSKPVCLSVTREASLPWCDHKTPEYPGSREASRRTLQGRWLHHWSGRSSYAGPISLPMLFASVGISPLWMFSHNSRMGPFGIALQSEPRVSIWSSLSCLFYFGSINLRLRSFPDTEIARALEIVLCGTQGTSCHEQPVTIVLTSLSRNIPVSESGRLIKCDNALVGLKVHFVYRNTFRHAPSGNKPAMVLTHDKPLPEPMLTEFTDAYLPRQTSIRYKFGWLLQFPTLLQYSKPGVGYHRLIFKSWYSWMK